MLSITASACTYTANGSQTRFYVASGSDGIYFDANSDLTVTLRSGDTITLQTIGTHYTVTGAGSDDGYIDFLTAPTSGYEVRIERNTPLTQTLNLSSAGAFNPVTIGAAFDKQMRAIQDVARGGAGGRTDAGVVVPDGTDNSDPMTKLPGGEQWDAENLHIRNLSDGVEDDDAVTVKQLNEAIFGTPPTGLSLDRITLPYSTTALPTIRFEDTTTGFNAPNAGDIRAVIGGIDGFAIKEVGGYTFFGEPSTIDMDFPQFQFEGVGRTKLRTRSLILNDMGDTPELAFYCGAGGPDDGDYEVYDNDQLGQQMGFLYFTVLGERDTGSHDAVLANTHRTIAPILHGGGAQTASIYMPSITDYQDGQIIHIRFTAASGTTPSINLNGWGVRALKRNSGSSPAVNFWNDGAEASFTYVAASSEFRATTASDVAAGRTDRAGFANPNWARSAAVTLRMPEFMTERSRPGTLLFEVTRPGETILRPRAWISSIGSTVIGGTGAYEDAADQHGIAREDYYPGDLSEDPTDDMYSGNYDASIPGPETPINCAGWAGLSVVAPKHDKWAAVGIRKSGSADVGFDIAINHSTDNIRFERAWPAGSSTNILTVSKASNGLARVGTSGAHGLTRREVVRIASVTGMTEINGVWTVWPVSSTTFDLLGSNPSNAYVSGGTIVKAERTVAAELEAQTGNWYFGAAEGAHDFEVVHTASAVNRVRVFGGTTGNGGGITVTGSDTNIPLEVQTKGTGAIRFLPGGTEALRINQTASAVNYGSLTPGATGNGVNFAAAGSDSNISFEIQSKGTSPIRLLAGGVEGVRVLNTPSAVNYLAVTPAATGGDVNAAAAGSDSNINLVLSAKGTGHVDSYVGGARGFRVVHAASAANYLQAEPTASAAGIVTLSAQGSDTNLDLRIDPKGAGVVDFGYADAAAATPGSFVANRMIAIKVNGNIRYIPAMTATW